MFDTKEAKDYHFIVKETKRLIGELTTHTKDGSFLLRFFFRKNIWTEFVDIFHSNYNIESLTTQQG